MIKILKIKRNRFDRDEDEELFLAHMISGMMREYGISGRVLVIQKIVRYSRDV